MATVHDEPTSPWAIFGITAAGCSWPSWWRRWVPRTQPPCSCMGQIARGVSAAELPALLHAGGDPTAAWGPASGVTSPALFWILTAIALLAVAFAARRAWVWWRPRRDRLRFRSKPGRGSRWRALREVGGRALVNRGSYLLPGTTVCKPEQLGPSVGWLGSRKVYACVEDSGLIIGPPRCGKGVCWSFRWCWMPLVQWS